MQSQYYWGSRGLCNQERSLAKLKHQGDTLSSVLWSLTRGLGQAQIPPLWGWYLCCLWVRNGVTRIPEAGKIKAKGPTSLRAPTVIPLEATLLPGTLSSSRTQAFPCLRITSLCPILSLKQILCVLRSSQRTERMADPEQFLFL